MNDFTNKSDKPDQEGIPVRRFMSMIMATAVLAVVGCGGSGNDGPKEVPLSEDDSYETAIYAEARSEWEPLAEQGDATAQKNLGMMHYLGQGVAQDFSQAFEWLGKAASQGEDVAQLTLGVMYGEGQGVPQNKVEALKWLTLSQAQGNISADKRLKDLIGEMNREQIAEGKDLAKAWQPGQ